MALREIQQRAARGRRIRGARRIVRIDDNERACVGGHQLFELIQIGHPLRGMIQTIERCARPDLGQHRRVERVRRHRDEHLAAFVDKRGHRELDAFRRPCRDEDPVGRYREAASCVFGCDGFPCRRNARRRTVPVVTVA